MNKQRRKKIDQVISKLEDLQNEVNEIYEEEQEYFDNMPESFQNGDKGSNVQVTIDDLESTISILEDIAEQLRSAKEY